MRDSQHTQNIHVNKVIGENEKCVFYFTAKAKWTFQPTRYIPFFFFFKILFIFREGEGGRKRARETSMCVCLSCVPYWGPGLQPRHVP